LFSIGIYFLVFILLSIILSFTVVDQTTSAFDPSKSKIAVFNEDGDSPLTQGLIGYLAKARALSR
jgi:hypothetical protein